MEKTYESDEHASRPVDVDAESACRKVHVKQQSAEKKRRLWDRWRTQRNEQTNAGSLVDAITQTHLELDTESSRPSEVESPESQEPAAEETSDTADAATKLPSEPAIASSVTDTIPPAGSVTRPESIDESPSPETTVTVTKTDPTEHQPTEREAQPSEPPKRSPFHVEQTEDVTPEATGSPLGGDSPIARELADLTARQRTLENTTVELSGRTRVITVSNQKGGVGKTTTAVNLAAALSSVGARVLVVDLDPQGNASTALGIPHTSDTPSVYDVLIDEFPMADIIQTSPESELLTCAPSTIHLAGAEIELVSQVAREHRLRTALEAYLEAVADKPDFVLIDCPPSLGLLTINAFTAADEVLIPIQCEYYALEGLSQLLGNVQMIQKHLNQRLRISTIVLTMFDGRTRLAQQVADEVRAHFTNEVLETVIPRSVRVSEAPSFGQTVIAYDGQSAGAVAYREAAVEMIRRENAAAVKEGDL